MSEERALNKKIRDPVILADLTRTRVLFDDGATYKKTFDSTDFIQSSLPIKSYLGCRVALELALVRMHRRPWRTSGVVHDSEEFGAAATPSAI
jgi:hypothetical protein